MASYLRSETVLGPSQCSLRPMLSIAGAMRGNEHCACGGVNGANWNVKENGASSSQPSTWAHLGEWEKPMKTLLRFSKKETLRIISRKGHGSQHQTLGTNGTTAVSSLWSPRLLLQHQGRGPSVWQAGTGPCSVNVFYVQTLRLRPCLHPMGFTWHRPCRRQQAASKSPLW